MQPYMPSVIYGRDKELVIADFLSRDCELVGTAGSRPEDMEVLAIVPMAETTLNEIRTVCVSR